MKSAQEKIVLNVGGVRYETYCSTLMAFPGTKLCRLTEPQAPTVFDYDPSSNEFFFDRSARLFGEVLDYYRTKHLHCPEGICKSVLEEELAFWEIGSAALDPCCWERLNSAEGHEEAPNAWSDHEDSDSQGFLAPTERNSSSWRTRWQPKVWALFEKPFSSFPAKCLALASLLVNIGICILFIGRTEVQIQRISYYHAYDYYHHHNETTYYHEENRSFYSQYPYLLPLELLCVLWFIFEFSVRLTFCPDKKKFLWNPLNVADFLSFFPVFIELFSSRHAGSNSKLVYGLGFLRVAYFFKLLKIFKLIETPLMLRVLPYTFKSVLREIFILMVIFGFEVLFFGALAFFGDLLHFTPDTYFSNLLSSFWWAVITLTTVGYGDMYPITVFGQIIGTCTAVCGVLTIVIPIPIFFIKFKGYYDAAIIKEKRKRKKNDRNREF